MLRPSTKACSAGSGALPFRTFKGSGAAPATTSAFSLLSHPCSTEGWCGALPAQHQGVRAGSQAQSFCTVSRLTFGTFKGFAYRLFLCSATLAEPKACVELCLPSTKASVLAARRCLFVRFRDWPLARSKALQQLQRRPRLFLRAATLAAPKACSVPAPRRALLAARRCLFVRFRDWPFAPSKAPQQLQRRHRLFLCSATVAAPKAGVEFSRPSTKASVLAVRRSLFVRFRDWPLAPSKALQQLQSFSMLSHPCRTQAWCGALSPQHKGVRAGSQTQSFCTVSRLTFGTFKGPAAAPATTSSFFMLSHLAAPKASSVPAPRRALLPVTRSLLVRFRDWPLAPSKALQQLAQSFCTVSKLTFGTFKGFAAAPASTSSFSMLCHPCGTQGWYGALSPQHQGVRAGSQTHAVSSLTFGTFKGPAAAPKNDLVFFYAQPPLQHPRRAPSQHEGVVCWQSGAVFLYRFETDLWHLQRLCSSSSLISFFSMLSHPCSTQGWCGALSQHQGVRAGSHTQSFCTVSRLTFGTFKGLAAGPETSVFLYAQPPLQHLHHCSYQHQGAPAQTSTLCRWLVSTLHWRLSGFPAVLRTWPSSRRSVFHLDSPCALRGPYGRLAQWAFVLVLPGACTNGAILHVELLATFPAMIDLSTTHFTGHLACTERACVNELLRCYFPVLYAKQFSTRLAVIHLSCSDGTVRTPFTEWTPVAEQLLIHFSRPLGTSSRLPRCSLSLHGMVKDFGRSFSAWRFDPVLPSETSPTACTWLGAQNFSHCLLNISQGLTKRQKVVMPKGPTIRLQSTYLKPLQPRRQNRSGYEIKDKQVVMKDRFIQKCKTEIAATAVSDTNHKPGKIVMNSSIEHQRYCLLLSPNLWMKMHWNTQTEGIDPGYIQYDIPSSNRGYLGLLDSRGFLTCNGHACCVSLQGATLRIWQDCWKQGPDIATNHNNRVGGTRALAHSICYM